MDEQGRDGNDPREPGPAVMTASTDPDCSGRTPDRRRSHRRIAAIVGGGIALGVLAILVVGALDDAPHDGDADLRTPAATDDNDAIRDRTITVVGQGRSSASPDAADIHIGVEVTEDAANAALDRANESAQLVLDLVAEAGVDDADVQTTGLSIQPVYGDDGRVVIGYIASNRLVVTVRDLDSVGGLLDAAVGLAGDDIRIDGISFVLDDASAVEAEARTDAMADARARAEGYAEAAGLALGEVLAVTEIEGGVPPRPAYAADEAASSDRVPIAAGEIDRTANVTVVYAIG